MDNIGKMINFTDMSNPEGWVLYDGKCGFCSWWIPFWEKTIKKTGFNIAMLQEEWVKVKLGLDEENLNRDIILLFNNGKKLIGADAYIFGMKTVWWSKPFGYLLWVQPLRKLTWVFYKLFNRNRFLVSKICRLKPVIQNNRK
ncbi:MAG: DUF393 domain-containing protein [Ignavibacteria bacterium]|nr:DUF393 domain-containing protein [Ignavibacteria bacterium]